MQLREGIAPAQGGEPREIAVSRAELRSVLDSQGREMRVADEVAGGPRFLE